MSGAYGDGEWLERHDHPLLNNVILDIVFYHLGRKNLMECRLVCKAWNVSTIPFTRKAIPVTIFGNHNLNKHHTIDNFLKLFGSNVLGIPFGRFKLGTFCTTDEVGQEFLQLCGHLIKEIEFVQRDYTIEDLTELLKSTPKLECFLIPYWLRSRSESGNLVKLFPSPNQQLMCLKKLFVFFDNREKRNKFCPTFLEELITVAPNISSIHIYDSMDWMSETGGEKNDGSSVEVLSLIEKLGRESCVQELQLSHEGEDDSEYFQLLQKMTLKPNGLKLKRFKYQPVCFDEQDTHMLYDIVSLSKGTLEQLTINGGSIADFTKFLKMPHLASLSIDLSDNFTTEIVNLNDSFPVLNKLELFNNITDCPEFDEFFPESDPCSTMNTFYTNIILHINEFNQMLTVFPKLSKLSLTISEDGPQVLRQIWSQLTQLTYLHIDGRLESLESVDSVLTGISTHALEEMRHAVDNLEKITTEEIERREIIMKLKSQYSQLPSIRNLTHLRSLDLNLNEKEGKHDVVSRTRLTNLTGYLGLYSMEHLQKLKIKCCELTRNCCEILTKEMIGLQSWTFRTEHGTNIIPSEQN